MHDATIATINERAIYLRSQGRLREAVAAFSEGIVKFPNAAVLYNNLAMTLDELGAAKEALLAYESALMRAPNLVEAMVGKASLLLREGRIDEAKTVYDGALAVDPDCLAAHLGLYELLQIKGDLAGAVAHQRSALAQRRVFTHRAPNERRSVLVLCAPGDWQANVPVDFLFDRATTTTHKLYLVDDDVPPLPRYDVVFNAVAESDEAIASLSRAQRFLSACGKPAINAPVRVMGVGRRELAKTLADADVTVAPIAELQREELASGDLPFPYPVIARPVGSHAGHDLVRLAAAADLAAYLATSHAPAYFVSPFVDYSNGDGLFRKYRIVFVDGVPYPVHLAISPKWMIHYYNAPMAEHAWMREEEAAFLANLEVVFAGPLRIALEEIAVAVGLEYFGIDATIGPDGRILVFEADPAMLVHTTDSAELYPYKHEYIPRIYRAVEAMLDRRKAADT